MSDSENGSAEILSQRLRLGAGFGPADRDRVLDTLSSLGRHLAHWSPDRVDLEISVKDRRGVEQKVTLEAWLPGWPALVATSAGRELDHALVEVRKEMIRQIEDEKAKRGPHHIRSEHRPS
jgi:ribosome-associated translation inhibitor RaiA